MEAESTKSNNWIVLSLLSGLTFGLSNVFMGIGFSHLGLVGVGLVGPICVLMPGMYRIVQACRIKKRIGTYIDYPNSNYWRKVESANTTVNCDSDNFQTAADSFKFNWRAFNLVVFAQVLLAFCGGIFVTYAFKFSLISGMN